MTLNQRRLVAMYVLDRADQYENESPCWVALCDVARNVLMGAVEDAFADGAFDAALRARIERIERTERVVMAGRPEDSRK